MQLVVVVLAAIAVRVAWLRAFGPTQITWDGAEYARSAMNLAHGHGYVGMHGTAELIFPPAYPAAIALVAIATHDAERAGVVVSIVAGAAIVIPVWLIARQLSGRGAALFAATMAACIPIGIDLSTVVLSDVSFVTLACLALALQVRAAENGRVVEAAGAGALYGLAYLTRPEGLLLGAGGLAALLGAARVTGVPVVRSSIGAAVFSGALLLVAAPEVAFLSSHAGSLHVEGKSAVNAAIAQRMEAGMSYAQAADAVDADGRRVGAELDENGTSVTSLPWRERFAVLGTALRRRIVDVPRALVSRPFGSVVLAFAAAVGVLLSPWSRRRVAGDLALLVFAATEFAALCSVYHFWPRYALGFTPLLAVWGGRGFDLALHHVTALPRPLVDRTVLAAIVILGCAGTVALRGWFRDTVNDATPLAERSVGTWLATQASAGDRVLSVSDQAVYYARALWSMLPVAPSERAALAYLRAERPRWIVLDADRADERPYVRAWLAHGIPDAHVQRVYTEGPADRPTAAIDRWNDQLAKGASR